MLHNDIAYVGRGLMTPLPGVTICGLLHNDIAYVGRGLMTPLPELTSLPKMWASAVDAWDDRMLLRITRLA